MSSILSILHHAFPYQATDQFYMTESSVLLKAECPDRGPGFRKFPAPSIWIKHCRMPVQRFLEIRSVQYDKIRRIPHRDPVRRSQMQCLCRIFYWYIPNNHNALVPFIFHPERSPVLPSLQLTFYHLISFSSKHNLRSQPRPIQRRWAR